VIITATTIAIVTGAGVVAGSLGALLGIGGGVFLVPFLHVVLGFPFKVAGAISLMTVVATSSAVSARTAGRHLINLRLGMLLEVASAAGGLVSAFTLQFLPERLLYALFALVTATIAALMMARLDRRNILPPGQDPGRLGGRYFDPEHGREVSYRVRRLPLGLSVSFVAGYVSGSFGIGGGVLKVPVLNAWCGMPIRAAAATSGMMIGVTAVSSVPIHYAHGYILPPVAGAAVLGVLVGSRAGFWIGDRSRARWLKLLMAAVLAAVSTVYWFKAA
jgi:uncharacterized membrane protein YfcA